MAKTFHLTIARVGENLFAGEAQSVTLPGKEGVFTVLAGHEAFVSELKSGTVKIIPAEGEVQSVEIPEGGIAEISSNQVTVIL